MNDDSQKTISDILNGRRMLEVPYYQRSYVWGEEQWERFANDMQEMSASGAGPYFMGAIILKLKDGGVCNDTAELRVLVDGQQRITTLFVYMKVLSIMKGKPKIFNTFMLSEQDGEDPTIEALRHNHIDSTPFKRIMGLDTLEILARNDKGEIDLGKPKLFQLYEYFKEHIRVDRVDSDRIKRNMRFVTIIVQEKEDEQQIFDAINSLGVKLTTAELLKNFFFNQNNEADYKYYWEPVFEKEAELKQYWDAEIVSGGSRNQLGNLFFSAFLNIKIHDPQYGLSTDEKIKYGKVDRLFMSYKNFVDRFYGERKLDFVKEVVAAASSFRKFFRPDAVGEALTDKHGFERINLMMFGMDFSILIPYVLNVLLNVGDENERNSIFDILESYLMRRLVCRCETRGYYKLFSDTLLSDVYLSASALRGYIESKTGDEVSESPDRTRICEEVHKRHRTNKQNASILYMLESRLRSDVNATVIMGFKGYSLEHLLPRNWRGKWDMPTTEEACVNRDRMLQTLGNMTIIPDKLNSSISNAAWGDKLAGRKGKKGLKACASGLATMDVFLMLPKWDECEINKRSERLASWMDEVWPRYGEFARA